MRRSVDHKMYLLVFIKCEKYLSTRFTANPVSRLILLLGRPGSGDSGVMEDRDKSLKSYRKQLRFGKNVPKSHGFILPGSDLPVKRQQFLSAKTIRIW